VPKWKRYLELFEDFCIVADGVRKGIEVNIDVEIVSSVGIDVPEGT
jgi:hypothetical protein